MSVFSITTRDRIFGVLVTVGAIAVLFALVYAINIVVQHWLPVGCAR